MLSLFTPREVAERLGARMMQLRLARDWRRATLAERAGVSPATVARFETSLVYSRRQKAITASASQNH